MSSVQLYVFEIVSFYNYFIISLIARVNKNFSDVLPHFKKRAEQIVSALTEVEKTSKDGDDENQTEMETKREVDEMIDACQLVYDAVTDIRHALLMNRNPEDVDSDNEYEEGYFKILNFYFFVI